jgi:hypothetical protein
MKPFHWAIAAAFLLTSASALADNFAFKFAFGGSC